MNSGRKDRAPEGDADAPGRACALGTQEPLPLPPQPLQCMYRPQRPLLLWDGQCGFCERWARRIKRLAGKRIDCEPYQRRLHDFPEITPGQFDRAVFLILPDGSACHSAEAIYRALALRRPLGLLHWLYRRCPTFARISNRRYSAIAASRSCRR